MTGASFRRLSDGKQHACAIGTCVVKKMRNDSVSRELVNEEQGGHGNQAWQDAVKASLTNLPGDFDGAMTKACLLQRQFLVQLAGAIAPQLNAALRSMPQESYEEKKLVTAWMKVLDKIGLTIRCPVTGRPGVLVADYAHDGARESRFRLETMDDRGRHVRTASWTELPLLELRPGLRQTDPTMRQSSRGR